MSLNVVPPGPGHTGCLRLSGRVPVLNTWVVWVFVGGSPAGSVSHPHGMPSGGPEPGVLPYEVDALSWPYCRPGGGKENGRWEGKVSEHLPGTGPLPQALKLERGLQSQAGPPRPLNFCIRAYGTAWEGTLKTNWAFPN